MPKCGKCRTSTAREVAAGFLPCFGRATLRRKCGTYGDGRGCPPAVSYPDLLWCRKGFRTFSLVLC